MPTMMGSRSFCALLVAVFSAGLLLVAPQAPIMLPDSGLYLEWAPTVPVGYPMFVTIFKGWWLILAQVALYALATFMLASEVRQLRFGRLLAPILIAGIFINPQTDNMLSSMLSEGLFLSLNIIFLCCMVAFGNRGSLKAALAGALLAGICATVRPASLPLGGVVVLACLLRWEGRTWRQRILLALGCLSLFTTVVLIERMASIKIQRGASTSLMGPHLFGKASLLDVPAPYSGIASPRERLIASTMEVEFAPVRKFLDSQRGTVAYQPLLAFYEVCLQHKCSHEMRAKLGLPPAEANKLIAHVAWLRIRQNPLAYAQLASSEYRSLWVFGVRTHPVLGPKYDSRVAGLQPLPLREKIAPEVAGRTPTSRAMAVIRPAFAAIGVVMALLCLLLGYAALSRAPSKLVLPSLMAALATQGIMLFTALAGIGDGRYTMGLWPNICTALILSLIAIGEWRQLFLRARKS